MIRHLQLTTADFDLYGADISDLEKASFRAPWSREAYRQELYNPAAELWVLLREGSFAGYCCFWVFAGELHLMKIAIVPSLRGRGLASVLLGRVIEAGARAGARSAWLEVRPSNAPALRLYLKHGFREAARRRGYYRDSGEDAIVMSRLLPYEGVAERKSGP